MLISIKLLYYRLTMVILIWGELKRDCKIKIEDFTEEGEHSILEVSKSKADINEAAVL